MRPRALLVAHLCEEAADLSSGWSPLHVAACMDDVEATEALLQAGFSALAEAPLTRARYKVGIYIYTSYSVLGTLA